MALSNNFYNEIFEKEKHWIELINKNLLNVYYINGKNGLKEFYLKKKEELQYEYNLTNNDIIGKFLKIVNEILLQIDFITKEYRNGNKIHIGLLSKSFLVNQMNNNTDNSKQDGLTELQIKKEMLEKLREVYRTKSIEPINDDYLYEDFPNDEDDYRKRKTA